MADGLRSYPDRDECIQILRDNNCPEHVFDHILAVTELAIKIGKRFPNADLGLIEAGAMLHDIGRTRTHGIDHAVEGSKLACNLGLPEELIRIIERHIVAGITPEAAEKLGLPKKDYTPITIEERIVAHADNLFEGKARCKVDRTIEILNKKKLFQVAKRIKELHLALSSEAGVDLDEIQ